MTRTIGKVRFLDNYCAKIEVILGAIESPCHDYSPESADVGLESVRRISTIMPRDHETMGRFRFLDNNWANGGDPWLYQQP